jgi:hypothetical protein
VVRVAALVDGGLKVNIHRGAPKLAEASSATTEGPVRIHRSAGASPAISDSEPAPAAQAVETVAAAE